MFLPLSKSEGRSNGGSLTVYSIASLETPKSEPLIKTKEPRRRGLVQIELSLLRNQKKKKKWSGSLRLEFIFPTRKRPKTTYLTREKSLHTDLAKPYQIYMYLMEDPPIFSFSINKKLVCRA